MPARPHAFVASVKWPVPVVQVQEVLAAVVGVEGRIGHLVVVVAGDADEEVEVAVAVHVGERRRARVGGRP